MMESDRPKNPAHASSPNIQKQAHQEAVLTGASSLVADIDAVVTRRERLN